ncbi:MAG: hypothetical protein R3F31_27275 [Verrucomicrobiales bacterium]
MTVVDLEEAFLARRTAGEDKLYCEQDAHTTPPLACEIAAGLIKKELESRPWFARSAQGGLHPEQGGEIGNHR